MKLSLNTEIFYKETLGRFFGFVFKENINPVIHSSPAVAVLQQIV